MNRRFFLQVLSAIAGAAAITPAVAKSLPAAIPDTVELTLGNMLSGAFDPVVSTTAGMRAGTNVSDIVFPEPTKTALVTHIAVLGQIIPLASWKTVWCGDTLYLCAGSLRITEE